jgi:ubiquinone/menaquinone biosynthesis C-methylase UbiE
MQSAPINYWPKSTCARAFWGQQELPPYQRLLDDTAAYLNVRPGARWLDLGCGCGQLTEALWRKSAGTLQEIIGVDCAAENAIAFQRLCARITPRPHDGQIRFVCSDFSTGLKQWRAGSFDGVVSGLAIQYAESYSTDLGRWTTDAYDGLLRDILRVLVPAGSFVFSVNVPEPAWGKVALHSLGGVWRARRPARYLAKSLRMMRYGSWLKREARSGRFHYLPLKQIVAKLENAGFQEIEHRVTYVGQAYLFRCRKPGS